MERRGSQHAVSVRMLCRLPAMPQEGAWARPASRLAPAPVTCPVFRQHGAFLCSPQKMGCGFGT